MLSHTRHGDSKGLIMGKAVTSQGAMVLARPRRGTVGETRRVAHLFRAVSQDSDAVTALCGASFSSRTLELLDGPTGMPCTACLARCPS
jgi:hypothetical protein